jgi:4,5-dihydroxyphthalate decarboxylase
VDYGADHSNDPTLQSLIPAPEAAARKWYAPHEVVPINQWWLAKSDPGAAREIYRVLSRGKKAAGLPKAGAIGFLPFGLAACGPGLPTIIDYALQQSLIPRKIAVDDLLGDTTRTLEGQLPGFPAGVKLPFNIK